MFDISLIRSHGRKLVDETLNETPNPAREKKYLDKLPDHILNLIVKLQKVETKDLYPLKHFCRGLNKCILVLKDLKGPVFGEIVKAAGNVSAISLLMADDPVKAKQEFGELGDIKTNLINLLGILRVKIKDASAKVIIIKEAVAAK